MIMNGEARAVQAAPENRLTWRVSFITIGRITVSLPLGALLVCFFSAIIFQFDEVNLTVCKVQNSVPSISAVTGVTPQRYIWRVCIALHSAPRFAIGFVYYYYYMKCAPALTSSAFRAFVRVTFWVYTIENACLVLVSNIANVENYPIHEKIFVVFMVTSILYELLTLIVFKWAHPNMSQQPVLMGSYRLKCICFTLISCSTIGLLYFFYKHRVHCEPGAFTGFSACEYGIAVFNILFHFTAIREFGKSSWNVLDCNPIGYPEAVCPPISELSNHTPFGIQQSASQPQVTNGNNNKKRN